MNFVVRYAGRKPADVQKIFNDANLKFVEEKTKIRVIVESNADIERFLSLSI
jgi:hypothetical protein